MLCLSSFGCEELKLPKQHIVHWRRLKTATDKEVPAIKCSSIANNFSCYFEETFHWDAE